VEPAPEQPGSAGTLAPEQVTELEPAEPAPVPELAPAAAVATPPAREDRVEAPVWRIVAPDTPSVSEPPPPPQPVQPAAASAEPQWPTTPQWPARPQSAPDPLGFLTARDKASEGLWAAPSREVLAPPRAATSAPTAAVQSCVSCGLSLSANARFCRRCGSRQG